eukprot:6193323-Pleurochrysis_carterae.AAC.1
MGGCTWVCVCVCACVRVCVYARVWARVHTSLLGASAQCSAAQCRRLSGPPSVRTHPSDTPNSRVYLRLSDCSGRSPSTTAGGTGLDRAAASGALALAVRAWKAVGSRSLCSRGRCAERLQ